MDIFYQKTLMVSAFLLCLGSLGCSVALFVMEQQEIWGMVLSGAFATALELCKFAFFPIGLSLVFDSSNYKKVSGVFVLGVGLVLLVVSVGASVGFFESATTNKESTERKQGDQYVFLKSDIDNIDQQITKVNRVVDRYMGIDQQKQALLAMGKLDKLRIERRAAIDHISNIPVEAKGSATSIFFVVANSVGKDRDSVRYWGYFWIATLIDVCGVIALLLLSSVYSSLNEAGDTNEGGTTSLNEIKTDEPVKESKTPKETNEANGNHGKKTEKDLSLVVEKILSGAYGDRLSVRPITEDWQSIKLNSVTLKEILLKMIDDGQVKKEGRYYYLRQSVIT
mgnify:CR=1 FL=1